MSHNFLKLSARKDGHFGAVHTLLYSHLNQKGFVMLGIIQNKLHFTSRTRLIFAVRISSHLKEYVCHLKDGKKNRCKEKLRKKSQILVRHSSQEAEVSTPGNFIVSWPLVVFTESTTSK